MEQKNASQSSQSQFTKDFFKQFMTPKEKLVTVELQASLSDVAQIMRQKHVGDVVVMDSRNGKKVPIGIVTDRDITIESLGQNVDPRTLSVKDIMKESLATARFSDDIFSMVAKMKENGVNRLPVIGESGEALGIVTSKKLVQCLIQGLNDLSALSSVQHQKEKEVRH